MPDAGTSMTGKRVLVVGASSGIGRALALEAARRGAVVALGARRLELLESAVAEIEAVGGTARAWRCDVSRPDECADLVDEAASFMGGLDVVAYLSGRSPLVRVAEAEGPIWHELFATNVVGAAMVMRAALPHLRSSPAPVVMVTTHSMDQPWPWLTVYGSTKAALAELAKGLRFEEPGLRVVCVAVGPTATDFASQWDSDVATAAFDQWLTGAMLHYDVLSAEEMATAMLDNLADPNAPDDVLIAGPDTLSEVPED